MIRVYGSTITGKGKMSFDVDALSFIEAAGISQPEHQMTINELVVDIKKNNLWDKLTAVYPFIGGKAESHAYNLLNPHKYKFSWGSLAEHSIMGVVPRAQSHTNGLVFSNISNAVDSDVSMHMYIHDNKKTTNVTADLCSTIKPGSIMLAVHLDSATKTVKLTCGSSSNDFISVPKDDFSGMLSFTSLNGKLTIYQEGLKIGEKNHSTTNSIKDLTAQLNYDGYDNRRQFRFLAWGKGLESNEIFLLNTIIQQYEAKLNRSIGGSSMFDEDALSFIDKSGLVQTSHHKAVDGLVRDLKKYGLWGKLTAVYPFVGGNANAHAYNLVNPEKYKFTWGNLAEHSALGVVPRTQAHHNNLPVSDISSNAGNDVSIHMYVNPVDEDKLVIGVNSTLVSNTILNVYLNPKKNYVRFDCGTGANSFEVNSTGVSGFLSFSSLNNKQTVFHNGQKIAEKPNAPANIQSLQAHFNLDRSTLDNKNQFRFLAWGKGLTSSETLLLNAAIQKFQTALGRAIETKETPDANASAFIEAAQIKDANQKLAVNYLTSSLKSAGLWDKFTTLYPLVGGTHDSCKYNLIDSTKYPLANAEGVLYSKDGLKPTHNIEIGLFNELFPNYNTASKASSFDLYVQEDVESALHDFGFTDTQKGFCVFSNYTGREVYYLSSYTGSAPTANERISKAVNVPTNGLFSCQSEPNKLSIYKNGSVLVSEAKTPNNVPNLPVHITKNIRTLSLIATRKTNLTDAEFATYNQIVGLYQSLLNREVGNKPVFNLNFNELPIKDVSGNGWLVENTGVTLSDGAGRFSAGYLKLNRSMYAALYASGNFTIRTRVNFSSFANSGNLFGSTQTSVPNAPGTLYIYNGKLWFINDTWCEDGGLFGTLTTNRWYSIEVIVENKNFVLKLDGNVVRTGEIKNELRNNELYIGAQTNNSSASPMNLNCLIDYFELYDKAIK